MIYSRFYNIIKTCYYICYWVWGVLLKIIICKNRWFIFHDNKYYLGHVSILRQRIVTWTNTYTNYEKYLIIIKRITFIALYYYYANERVIQHIIQKTFMVIFNNICVVVERIYWMYFSNMCIIYYYYYFFNFDVGFIFYFIML